MHIMWKKDMGGWELGKYERAKKMDGGERR